jgi:hypothetical protein
MAQPGNFTPILLYGSSTPTNVPLAANLTNNAIGSEIAINVADKNLFFKDSTNAINTVPIRQSSTTSNGWLSATDWNTFNNKQVAGAYLTVVTADAPLSGAGTSASHLIIAQSNTTTNGYLSSTDWNTFNNKAPATTYTNKYIPFGQGTTTLNQSSAFQFDGTDLKFGTNLTNGIYFGASSKLNDYEEGTWTPALTYNFTILGTVTTTGTYTKIGRQVFLTIKITCSGGGSVASNQGLIPNLPYTAANPTIGGWGINSNYGTALSTQNLMVDGVTMYLAGTWPAVANYVYVASVTYTI